MHYHNIALIPRYSTLDSRSQARTTVQFGQREFLLPVVPANMPSIMNSEIAEELAETGHFYIMHRFFRNKSLLDGILQFIEQMQPKYISISIGVKKKDLEVIDYLSAKKIPVEYLTIDIAHGHSKLMRNMISYVKEKLPKTFIIAGNVCTAEAVERLEVWGAQAIKVGIAQGKCCRTYNKTGFGLPQALAIEECAEIARVPIIADGGIRENGDIAKALTLGGTIVMCGNLFTDVIGIGDGSNYYYGSASEMNGWTTNIEGSSEPIRGTVTLQAKLREIREDLQSGISYAGGEDLTAFKKVQWLTI